MNPALLLTAMTNPTTHAAAATLFEIATASMRLLAELDKPEMSADEKKEAWSNIKRHMSAGDDLLMAAIESHPAWRGDQQGPSGET